MRGDATSLDRCRDEGVAAGVPLGGTGRERSGASDGGATEYVGLPALWELGPSEVISVVGGGGKTTLIERLARGYEAEGSFVVITTTTKVMPPDPGSRPLVLGDTAAELTANLEAWWAGRRRRARVVGASPVVGTRVLQNGKLDGVPPEWMPLLRDLPWVGAVLVEADGAARLPLKAPAAWEPVVPACTSLLLVVAGLDAQDAPLDAEHVHRPELLADLLGLEIGRPIPSGRLCDALLAGYGRHAPAGSRMLLFLNKVDAHEPSPALVAAAAEAAVEAWAGSARDDGAVRCLRAADRRPAAVILAAGLGTRMAAGGGAASPTDLGVTKVLQSVGGCSLVARAAAAALACRSFAAVAVVVGADAGSIERALRAELGRDADRLRVVHNPCPADGQASSLRLGVAALPTGCDPVVLLADQPWVTVKTLARVVDAAAAHPRTAGVGLAVEGVVGPPVEVHRSLRPQIAALTGDTGARALLRRYPTRVVAVPALGDEGSDIDDPGDLARARSAVADRGE